MQDLLVVYRDKSNGSVQYRLVDPDTTRVIDEKRETLLFQAEGDSRSGHFWDQVRRQAEEYGVSGQEIGEIYACVMLNSLCDP